MSGLGVWWDGVLVATVTERRHRMRCAYTAADMAMLSVSMPPRSTPYDNRVARPFFHGLLPEGEARRMIAYDLGLGNDGATDMALLEALGRDVAGALVITSADRPPGRHPTSGPKLDAKAVARRLRDLPTQPLGVGGEVRLSLPGMQPKLLLARDHDGTWRLPADGAPSTHILKPSHPAHADTIGNELFCQRFASAVGVNAAITDVIDFDGVPALVSTRFDRLIGDDNKTVNRVHQEDLCQATSVLTESPLAKYQRTRQGRPSFAAAADILDRWGGRDQRERLIGQILVTVLVGNADLHGKNLSFLHHGSEVRLAPAYDITSTSVLPASTTLGMYIADVLDIHSVSPLDVVEEATRWGLRRAKVDAVVAGILDRALDAAGAAAEDQWVPPGVIDHIRTRIDRARTRYTARSDAPQAFIAPTTPAPRSRPPIRTRARTPCGALTRTGATCRNPAGSCPHHPTT